MSNTGRWTDEVRFLPKTCCRRPFPSLRHPFDPRPRPPQPTFPQEHAAFEDGLRQYGVQWKKIQTLVPTRTLVQIRTHAQKYFLRNQAPDAAASGGGGSDDDVEGVGPSTSSPPSGGGLQLRPYATLRHVLLDPVNPSEPLGLTLGDVAGEGAAAGFVAVTGFLLVESVPSAGKGLALSTPAESDLVRIGDIVVGVGGIATYGMDAAVVQKAIDASRGMTPGATIVLHLSDKPLELSVVEEAAVQMAAAAAQLLGGRGLVEAVHDAIGKALIAHQAAMLQGQAAAAQRGEAGGQQMS